MKAFSLCPFLLLHGHNTINILCHYEVQRQICILSQTQSQPVIVALISADITHLTYKSLFFLIISGNMTLLNTVLILFCLTMQVKNYKINRGLNLNSDVIITLRPR